MYFCVMTEEKINLVKKIHDSNLFGIVCETGCGQPLAQALYSVSGASQTLCLTESPYSKDYQDKKFGKDDNRAVSIEKVQLFLSYYMRNNPECNFYYVSSFQVGDETNKITTHGWIALYKYNESESDCFIRYYHVSIYESMSRQEYFDKIRDIGINLLSGNKAEHIDSIHITSNYTDLKLTLEHHMSSNNEENIVFIKDGKILRFENYLREVNNLILYKGSFNPPHIAHQEMAEKAKELYKSETIFCISTKIYQKDDVVIEDLLKRIKMLNILGYSVIISKKPYFKDLVNYIRLKYDRDITLLMGSDTFDRYLDTTPEPMSVNYVVFQRLGMLLKHDIKTFSHISDKLTILPLNIELSSTLIRNIISSNLTYDEKVTSLEKMLHHDVLIKVL